MKTKKLRTIVILAILALVAIGYCVNLAFGNLSAIGFDSISYICPLGALSAMIAAKTLLPRALVSLGIFVLLTVILGKVFCSWICPVPLFQGSLLKRAHKQMSTSESDENALEVKANEEHSDEAIEEVPRKMRWWKFDSRHIILLAAVVSTVIFGYPIFCLACPIGLTFASILVILELFMYGKLTWTVVVFPLIVVLELVVFRRWCADICPLGALVSLVSGFNRTFRPTVDNNKCLVTAEGKDCKACKNACPEQLNPRNNIESFSALGECTKCKKCADACPVKAINFPFRSNE